MKKIRPLLFACMLVFLSLSLTACAGRKSGNMNETSNNRATSSAAAETGTGENGMTGDAASGWKEGEERQSLLRQPVLKIGNVACFSPITKLVV